MTCKLLLGTVLSTSFPVFDALKNSLAPAVRKCNASGRWIARHLYSACKSKMCAVMERERAFRIRTLCAPAIFRNEMTCCCVIVHVKPRKRTQHCRHFVVVDKRCEQVARAWYSTRSSLGSWRISSLLLLRLSSNSALAASCLASEQI